MSPLDDHVKSALDRVRVSLSGQLEADLASSASDILRAASEAQERAAAEAAQRAATEAAERAASEARLEAEQRLSALRREFDQQRDDHHARTAAEISVLQRTVDEVRDQLAAAGRDIEDARQAREEVERQLEHSRREVEAGRRSAEEAQAEVETVKHELEDACRTSADRLSQAEDSERQLDEVRQRVELAQRDVEQARLEMESTRRELDTVSDALAQAERITASLRALDEAPSLGDVLDGLARLACQETGRTAVFLVNGTSLRGWRALGFSAPDLIVGADLQDHDAGVVGDAARSGRGQRRTNGEHSSLPAFAAGNGARHAVALPVEVGGSVIAVLYADAVQADRPEAPRWPDIVELMTRHAGRVLESLTVRQAAALSTRQVSTRGSLAGERHARPGGLS